MIARQHPKRDGHLTGEGVERYTGILANQPAINHPEHEALPCREERCKESRQHTGFAAHAELPKLFSDLAHKGLDAGLNDKALTALVELLGND